MRPSFLQCRQPLRLGSQLLSGAVSHPFLPFRRAASTSTPAIARSIREAVQRGNVNQGYRIFTKAHTEESIRSDSRGLHFNRSRFLAHVLLHALHRSPNRSLASIFAKSCLDNGIKIRNLTFGIIFSGLFRTQDFGVMVNGAAPQMSSSINSALSLFNMAQRSSHEQSTWMFDRFISNLLLHGEVLTAALLFVAIIKEWDASKQIKTVAYQETGEELFSNPSESVASVDSHSAQTTPRPRVSPLAAQWMRDIVNEIKEGSRLRDKTSQSVQALGALVNLLEGGDHFIPARWRLLRAMYALPPELQPDKTEYERWHQLLLDQCSSSQYMDMPAYHVLLQYALRERMSLDLGASVIKSLCRYHKPTPMTYNVLLRELVRLKDQAAVEAVNRLISQIQRPMSAPSIPSSSTSSPAPHDDIIRELLKHPVPLPDEFTAITSMSHDISSGDPKAACKFVADLFPALGRPKWGARRKLGGRYVTSRARKLSPFFWGKAIHAATEAGDLRLSIRIWRLLMKAEKARGHFLQLYSLEACTSHFELFFAKVWSIHRQTQGMMSGDMYALESRKRIWAQFMKYNYLLLTIQWVLESVRDRLVRIEAKFEVDQAFLKVVFSLVRYIHVIQQHLPQLGYAVANQRQRRQYFEETSYRRRVNNITAMVQNMFADYGPLAPRQLRQWGLVKSAEEPLPALRAGRRSIPYSMRKSGVVRKTRFGFKLVYSDRIHRFGAYEDLRAHLRGSGQ